MPGDSMDCLQQYMENHDKKNVLINWDKWDDSKYNLKKKKFFSCTKMLS